MAAATEAPGLPRFLNDRTGAWAPVEDRERTAAPVALRRHIYVRAVWGDHDILGRAQIERYAAEREPVRRKAARAAGLLRHSTGGGVAMCLRVPGEPTSLPAYTRVFRLGT